jgi:hypothetical protein
VLALLGVLAAQLMFALDLPIVVVALPRILEDLGFSTATLTWVPNAFGLAFGGWFRKLCQLQFIDQA